MGYSESKFENTYLLHHYSFGDNKLYVFLPRLNEFYCFSVFYCKRKYIFYADNSISLPNGYIYFIGGERLLDPLKENLLKAVSPTDNVLALNLNLHKDFRIDLDEFGIEAKRPLPEPRSFHNLVYVHPFIYVIGGVVENKFTKKCYKYNIQENKWSEIAEMLQNICQVSEPGTINIGNEIIYVFDSYAKKQTIHKYIISEDKWMLVPYETNGFQVLPAVSSLVFQISEQNIILINGMMKENEGYFYFFDFTREKFILEQKNHVLKAWTHDRQGDKNYTGVPLYCMMNEKKVKVFNPLQLEWREEDLFLTKIPHLDNSGSFCCGR